MLITIIVLIITILVCGGTSVYSDQMYTYERGERVFNGRPTSWSGKIALVYPSDCGCAADFNSCSKTLDLYNDTTCTSVNWIQNIISSTNSYLLTLTSTPWRSLYSAVY